MIKSSAADNMLDTIHEPDPGTARELVVDCCMPLLPEPVELKSAAGRVLADDLVAPRDNPIADVSSMDGYALADPSQEVHKIVLAESRAGVPAPGRLAHGQAIRISTGALVPLGANAVIPIEQARLEGDLLTTGAAVARGAHIRRAGSDFKESQVLIEAGERLRPGDIAALAAVGVTKPLCREIPRVALIATGDEVVDTGDTPSEGQIRDINSPMIASLIAAHGGELISSATVGDDRDELAARLAQTPECEVLLISGGMSVGRHDHVRPMLQEAGAVQVFWRLAARPGRPAWFGLIPRATGTTRVFGLPGNPVSAFAAFNMLVAPALRALSGEGDRPRLVGRLVSPVIRDVRLSLIVPCRARVGAAGLRLEPASDLQSHRVSALTGCDALAIVPPGGRSAEAGTPVEALLATGGLAA